MTEHQEANEKCFENESQRRNENIPATEKKRKNRIKVAVSLFVHVCCLRRYFSALERNLEVELTRVCNMVACKKESNADHPPELVRLLDEFIQRVHKRWAHWL
jgi:hypothetical protein